MKNLIHFEKSKQEWKIWSLWKMFWSYRKVSITLSSSNLLDTYIRDSVCTEGTYNALCHSQLSCSTRNCH